MHAAFRKERDGSMNAGDRMVFGLCILLSFAPFAAGITHEPLGPRNAGGTRNGAALAIGAGGTVYELDAFLYIPGEDLNGSNHGVVARLSADALPTGLVCVATNELLDTDSDLVLAYTFRNDGAQDIEGSRFFSFLDAEIDEEINTFFNEYGAVAGTPGAGSGDAEPDYWQIDEPGFMQGQILELLLDGTLGQNNGVPSNDVDDVSMALGFELGRLRPGETATVNIMISEDGDTLGEPVLSHYDAGTPGSEPTPLDLDDDGANGTVITFSGTTRLLPELTNVVVNGSLLVHGGDTESYLATAFFTDATTQDVTAVSSWSLGGDVPAGTALLGNDLVTVPVTGDVPVTVSAVYSYRGATMTGTLDVTIVPVLTDLAVAGTNLLIGGQAAPYTATAGFRGGLEQDVTDAAGWSLAGMPPPGMAMASNVLATVPVGAETGVTVQAVYTFRDMTVTGALDVAVVPLLTNLTVEGEVRVPGGTSEEYTATARFLGGFAAPVSNGVTWLLVGEPIPGIGMDSNTLHTAPVPGETPVTIMAVYGFRGVQATGTLDVVVLTEQAFLNVSEDVAMGFTWRQNYSTGELMGRMTVENTGAAPLTGPFQLALKPHDDFFFHLPDGEMPDGDEYRDLTAGFAAALPGVGDGDRVFDPGETVVVDDIAIYSRDRSPPPVTVFELWATSGVGGDAD